MGIKIIKLIHKVQNICMLLTLAIMGAISSVEFSNIIFPNTPLVDYILELIYVIGIISIYYKVKEEE